MIDWLSEWLIEWLIDWLIDWLIGRVAFARMLSIQFFLPFLCHRPTFAPSDESEQEDEDGFLVQDSGREYAGRRSSKSPERRTADDVQYTEEDVKDPRLQRLQRVDRDSDEDEERELSSRYQRNIAEPEIISSGSGLISDGVNLGRIRLKADDDSDEDEEVCCSEEFV